jgi:hypothetical protein
LEAWEEPNSNISSNEIFLFRADDLLEGIEVSAYRGSACLTLVSKISFILIDGLIG